MMLPESRATVRGATPLKRRSSCRPGRSVTDQWQAERRHRSAAQGGPAIQSRCRRWVHRVRAINSLLSSTHAASDNSREPWADSGNRKTLNSWGRIATVARRSALSVTRFPVELAPSMLSTQGSSLALTARIQVTKGLVVCRSGHDGGGTGERRFARDAVTLLRPGNRDETMHRNVAWRIRRDVLRTESTKAPKA